MINALSLGKVEGYAFVGGKEVALEEENMTISSIQAVLFPTIDHRCSVLLL